MKWFSKTSKSETDGKRINAVCGPDYEEEIIRNALTLEWDDDILKYTYTLNCECGGNYSNVHYFRRTFNLATYDIIECKCRDCQATRFFSFKPSKIHESINELIHQNIKYVRLS